MQSPSANPTPRSTGSVCEYETAEQILETTRREIARQLNHALDPLLLPGSVNVVNPALFKYYLQSINLTMGEETREGGRRVELPIYFQITDPEHSHVTVLDSASINELVYKLMLKRYPAFAGGARPKPFTNAELMEVAAFIVNDPTRVLRPAPEPGPPAPMFPAFTQPLWPNPAEQLFRVLAAMQQAPPVAAPLQALKSALDLNASASVTTSQRSSTTAGATSTPQQRRSTEVSVVGGSEPTATEMEEEEDLLGRFELETVMPPPASTVPKKLSTKGHHGSSKRQRTSSSEQDPAPKKPEANKVTPKGKDSSVEVGKAQQAPTPAPRAPAKPGEREEEDRPARSHSRTHSHHRVRRHSDSDEDAAELVTKPKSTGKKSTERKSGAAGADKSKKKKKPAKKRTAGSGDSDLELTGIDEPAEEITDWMRALKDPAKLPAKLEAASEVLLRGKVETIKKAPEPAVFKLAGKEHTGHVMMLQNLNLFRMLGGDAPLAPRQRNEVYTFVSNIQWRVTIALPPSVFRTPGKRSATPEERARLNLARFIKQDVLHPDRISKYCEDEISLTGTWLDKNPSAKVTGADLWKRYLCACDGLANFNNALVTIEGRDPTVVVARGLANATMIAQLLCEYSAITPGARGEIYQVDLANAGLYTLAKFANKYSSWCVGIEDCVLLALDLIKKGQTSFEGVAAQSVFMERSEAKLNFYLDGPKYPYERDQHLLEFFTGSPVREKVLSTFSASTFGTLASCWFRKNKTRVPVIYHLAKMCHGVVDPMLDEQRPRAMQELLDQVEGLARDIYLDPHEEPRLREEESRLHPDQTLDLREHEFNARFCGSIRCTGLLGTTPFQTEPGPFDFQMEDALIVVSRIGMYKETSTSSGCPVLRSLVVANAYGRILGVLGPDEMQHANTKTVGEENCGAPTKRPEMRAFLIKLLGSKGVLVGFGLGWLLTAIRLPLPAFRVVELGLESAYQQFVRTLAGSRPDLDGFFKVPMRVGYDRRWPAVLYGDGIDFYPAGGDSVLLESYYTAAIWQAVGKHIIEERARPEIFLVKNSYIFGYGDTVSAVEAKHLQTCNDYCHRAVGPEGKMVKVNQLKVKGTRDLLQLYEFDLDLRFPLTSEQLAIVFSSCEKMSRRVFSMVNIPEFPPPERVWHEQKSQVATWMTLATPSIGALDASMIVAWINNHYSRIPSALRTAQQKLPTHSKAAKYLMVSFIDLALESEWMQTALSQLESPLLNEPDDIPPKSLDMRNASVALVAAPSASSSTSAATPPLPAMIPLGTATPTPRPPPAPRDLSSADGTFEQVLAETTAPAPSRPRIRAGVKEMPKSGVELEADPTLAPAFGTRARTLTTPTSSAAPSPAPAVPSAPTLPEPGSPRRSARAPSPRVSSPQPSRRALDPSPDNAATTSQASP